MEIDNIITYNQLNTFLNLSLIKHIVFKSQINSKLFIDILRYNTTKILIEIDYDDLIEILRRTKPHQQHQIIVHFKKIKRLILAHKEIPMHETSIPLTKEDIKRLCYLFSNVEELTIKGVIPSSELIYLLNQLQQLYFLTVVCYDLIQIGHENIRQWLINQTGTKLNEKNFLCKWSEKIFYIWID